MGLQQELSQAKTIDDVLSVFDKHLSLVARGVQQALNYGASKEYRVNIKRARREANRKAIDIIERVNGDSSLLTDEDRLALAQYTGEGGIGGSIDEYYTPQWLAEGTWDQLKAYGFEGGNVLEPSAGTGVFLGTKPKSTIVTATEISPVSSAVNQLLHPTDSVENVPFERLAVRTEDGTYDAVVGNVPFGQTRITADLDPAYSHVKVLDEYFVERTIDKVKGGGLITLICPTRTVSGRKMRDLRERISRKAEFLGAHRIPSGTFTNSGSASVVTDVLVMRKFPDDVAEKLPDLTSDTLKEANVLWDTFISGQWFNKDGKKYIHGELAMTTNLVGKPVETVVIPNLTKGSSKAATSKRTTEIDNFNASIKAKLAKPFKSRINWALLESAEPIQTLPTEGDCRFINGRQHTLQNGEWIQTALSESGNGELDAATYGADNERDISRLISSPELINSLSFEQIQSIYSDMRDLIDDQTLATIRLAKESGLSDAEQYRIIRGCAIGRQIQSYQDAVSAYPYDAQAMLPAIQKQVADEFDTYGAASEHKAFRSLSGSMSREFFMFANSTDSNGALSDLLQGKIDRSDIKTFNSDNPNSVLGHLFNQINLDPVNLADFRQYCTDAYCLSLDDQQLLAHLATFDDIAITETGQLIPWGRATSGYVTDRLGTLALSMNQAKNRAVKDNYSRQIDEIKRKRKWNTPDTIAFTMRSKWIPRSYILEFLQESGFTEFSYSQLLEDEDGNLTEDENYTGTEGQFTGYYTKNGKRLSDKKENRLSRQLEKYLNGERVRGKDASNAAIYRDQIRLFEEQFSQWMKVHADIDDITQLYNDAFNNFINYEHSGSDLELQGVSGDITLMSYQNQAIRRLSEDGRGILGFDTGLGKTLTALGLVAFNIENGRSRRTGITVPKAVYQNWFNECVKFFGANNLSKIYFPGLEPELDSDGQLIYDSITNEEGKTEKTIRVKTFTGKELTARVNAIPHSAYPVVVFSKEVFEKIPLKPETLDDNARDKLDTAVAAGKASYEADNYTAQNKRLKILANAKEDGGEKKSEYAYFEDMAFDNIIADEGHLFRNSIKPGFESSQLAYLPTAPESNIAVDLRQKSAYLNKRYGRGTVLLTATPTVNSPLDVYNMLSHIISEEEWQRMGISDQDDFITMFGETAEVQVQKLSGAIVERQGLVGFKNLTALRSMFNRFTNIQNAKTVKKDVIIPDLEQVSTDVELTEEQLDIYEELRFRAEVASLVASDSLHQLSPTDRARANELIARYPDDQTFAIIRDMDRVTNDIDLYKKTITYVFKLDDKAKVDQLIASLPEQLVFSHKVKEDGKTITEEWEIELNSQTKVDKASKTYVVTASQEYEDLIAANLAKFKINENDVTHPTPPKVAAMLEILKKSVESGGKCLIFTEEKITHRRLHRTICKHLGLPKNQVGIINADTVSGATSYINESVKAKAIKTKKGASAELAEEKGLEAIAKQYNSGKIRVLICNKKCEVGVNLHKGTTDIFHLTLPWTPASIDQRNGRGARVGSTQSKVLTHFFNAKGSFDEFRLGTINRKRKWISELLNGDQETAKNEDVDDGAEQAAMVARDPEERARRLELIRIQEEKKRREKQRNAALINVSAYLKAFRLGNVQIESLNQKLTETQAKIEQDQAAVEKHKADIAELTQQLANVKPGVVSSLIMMYRSRLAIATEELPIIEKRLKLNIRSYKATQTQVNRVQQAENTIKRIKPLVQKAIDDGLLIGNENQVLTHPTQFLEYKNELFQVGDRFLVPGSNRGDTYRVVEIDSIVFESSSVRLTDLRSPDRYKQFVSVSELGKRVSYTESDSEKLNAASYLSLSKLTKSLTESEFRSFARDGLVNIPERYVLIHKDDEFDFIEGYKRIDPKFADVLVYPDPLNTRLRDQLLGYCAKLKENDRFNKYAYEDYLELIAGDNWEQQIQQAGNAATPDFINNSLVTSLNDILNDDEVIELKNKFISDEDSYSFESRVKDYLFASIPTGFSNGEAFSEQARILIDKTMNDVKAFKATEEDRQIQANEAKYAEYQSQSVSQIKERVSALLDAICSYSNDDHRWFMIYHRLRKEPTLTFYRDDPVMLLADLTTVGAKSSYLVGDKIVMTDRKAINFLSERRSNAFNGLASQWNSEEDNPLATYLNQEQQQQEVMNPVHVEIEDLTLPPITDILSKRGISITKNNYPVTVRLGRRKYDFDSYELLAMQSEDRRLQNASSQISEAGGFRYENASQEFPGVWHFLPGTTTDEGIIEAVFDKQDQVTVVFETLPDQYQPLINSVYEEIEGYFRFDEGPIYSATGKLFANRQLREIIDTPNWYQSEQNKEFVSDVIRTAVNYAKPNYDVPESLVAGVLVALITATDQIHATGSNDSEISENEKYYRQALKEAELTYFKGADKHPQRAVQLDNVINDIFSDTELKKTLESPIWQDLSNIHGDMKMALRRIVRANTELKGADVIRIASGLFSGLLKAAQDKSMSK